MAISISSLKSRKYLIILLSIITFIGLGVISLQRQAAADKAALEKHIPVDYAEVFELYGESGPAYEKAMARYVPTVMCEHISGVLSDLEFVEAWLGDGFDSSYPPVGATTGNVLTVNKVYDEVNIDGTEMDDVLEQIMKYTPVKGTNGVEQVKELRKVSLNINQAISDERVGSMTRSEWLEIKSVLTKWHNVSQMDPSLRACVKENLIRDYWVPRK